MEKTNYINVIVSIILSIAGIGFIFYSVFVGSNSTQDIILILIGILLIIYGITRYILIQKAIKDLS